MVLPGWAEYGAHSSGLEPHLAVSPVFAPVMLPAPE